MVLPHAPFGSPALLTIEYHNLARKAIAILSEIIETACILYSNMVEWKAAGQTLMPPDIMKRRTVHGNLYHGMLS